MINFAPLVNDSPFAIYTCDKDGFITYYNSAAAILWGRSPKIGKELLVGTQKMFFPNGLPMPLDSCPMAMTLKQGVAYDNQQLSIQRADGTFKSLRVFSRPVFDEHGALIGSHNTLAEPTKDSEQDTKSAILSAIIEHSDDAIISKDLNGIIKSWNKGAERIFGYTEAEAVGKSILMLIPQSRRQEEDLILDSIRNGKLVGHFETVRLNKNGLKIPISLTISPIKNSEGLIVGASKVARDISIKHEDAAKQAILAAIVEFSEDAVISKQLDGTITSWNEAANRIFGYTEEEVVGKSITLLIPSSRFKEEQEIIESIKKGKKVDHFQTIRLHKNGHEIDVSLAVSPIKNIHGEIIGASKVARDITEQIRSQELIKKYTENLETLNAIGKSIAEKMDVETILQRVTDATTKITGAAFGAFFYNTLNEQGESYMLYTLSGAPRSAFENFGMPRNTAVFAPTFSGKGIMRVDDITADPRYGRNAPHFGMPKGHLPVVSFLSVPVISNSGKVIGGLFFGHPEKGVFKEEHERVIASVALQAAVAIDNSKLFEEVKSLSAKKDEFIALASHELKTPLTS
ncbi:MAG TPA: PAS domain S-box protein, partial [Pelobium sp.]|nr:PAS domain S-box protein [Pelobium sp.]